MMKGMSGDRSREEGGQVTLHGRGLKKLIKDSVIEIVRGGVRSDMGKIQAASNLRDVSTCNGRKVHREVDLREGIRSSKSTLEREDGI